MSVLTLFHIAYARLQDEIEHRRIFDHHLPQLRMEQRHFYRQRGSHLEGMLPDLRGSSIPAVVILFSR